MKTSRKPARPSLAQACACYVHRYTMEHVPAWAQKPCEWPGEGPQYGRHYAPNFRTDAEWYANTIFPGEPDHPDYPHKSEYCYTTGQTWPLGHWLDKPFNRNA